MIKEQLYRKTCDILFDAYFNDTLEHGQCCACAVGNIVAANMGLTIIKDGDGMFIWENYECYNNGHFLGWFYPVREGTLPTNQQLAEINSTGYEIYELNQIESAFERSGGYFTNDEKMFNGLCAVIEVLNKIHEVEEDTQTVRFKNHYKSKIVLL